MKNNKSLVIEAKAEDVVIENLKGLTRIKICNDLALSIEMDNDVLLKAKGDFVIVSQGEINFISDKKPICIDTLNSEIHLNSREGKYVKDLPESIVYRQKMIEENKRCIQIADMAEQRNKLLKDRVTILEKLVEDIANKLINDFERKG